MNYFSCKLIFLARYMLMKKSFNKYKTDTKIVSIYFVQNKNKNKYKTDRNVI